MGMNAGGRSAYGGVIFSSVSTVSDITQLIKQQPTNQPTNQRQERKRDRERERERKNEFEKNGKDPQQSKRKIDREHAQLNPTLLIECSESTLRVNHPLTEKQVLFTLPVLQQLSE